MGLNRLLPSLPSELGLELSLVCALSGIFYASGWRKTLGSRICNGEGPRAPANVRPSPVPKCKGPGAPDAGVEKVIETGAAGQILPAAGPSVVPSHPSAKTPEGWGTHFMGGLRVGHPPDNEGALLSYLATICRFCNLRDEIVGFPIPGPQKLGTGGTHLGAPIIGHPPWGSEELRGRGLLASKARKKFG